MLDAIERVRAVGKGGGFAASGVARHQGFVLPFPPLSSPAAAACCGFAEDPVSPPSEIPRGGREPVASAPLAALSGSALARRFWTWNGASGRRYICSVFSRDECPAFAEAIVIAVRNEIGGARRIVFICASGPRLRGDGTGLWYGSGIAEFDGFAVDELHIHLLCDSATRRCAAMEDLALACCGLGVPVIYPPA